MTTAIIILVLLVAIIVLAAVFARICNHLFYSSFLRRSEQIRNESESFGKAPAGENDTEFLPPPVARYLYLSGLRGKSPMSYAHLRHSGFLRISKERSFTRVKGEYFLTARPPSFCWFGKAKFLGIPVFAFDSYFKGNGRMVVKLLSFFKLVDSRSKETGISALGRCIAELSMAPSFFLDKERITWTAFDSEKAFCKITDSGITINAELYFHSEGMLDRIVIQRYFDRGNGKFTLEKFTGQASVYKDFGGFQIPTVLDGYWNLEEGDLHYVHFKIEEAEFE
ncbi:MAG TPA: DUF6544 family protein [Bacteroidales bacterium]|nr:DUF6544 family protein [Bacteroidales bacterium]